MNDPKKTHDCASDQAFAARIATPVAGAGIQVLAAARSAADVTWTDTLLFAPADSIPDSDALEELPADYRAITDIWLDG